jgi:hypothetical protein
MTKPLTKLWRCPTCDVGFKASEAREAGKRGRRCPNGHFHSYYELKRHENGKPIRTGWRDLQKGKHYGEKPMASVPRGTGNKAELLALLWVAAYEKLMDQLPASTSRLLVEGAMAQAYRASRVVLESGR